MQMYCRRLADLALAGRVEPTLAGLAKADNTSAAREVLSDARDLLGGNGLLLDFHVVRHMADIEAIHTYEPAQSSTVGSPSSPGPKTTARVPGPFAECSDVADVHVRVDPLTDDDVEHLLRRALRARPDPVLVEKLRRALGPLGGNPAHILAMLDQLRRTGRLVTVARRVCLREPNRTPTLPSDVPTVVAAGEPGGIAENLLLVVGSPARVRVDDVPLLAAALGRTVRDTGREIDRLVAGKTLDEHEGQLVVRCPAVGATVRERASAGRVRALHAAVALVAVDPAHDDLARLDHDVLADHVVAAGEALAPDPVWESVLRGQARDEEQRRPERAARLLLASGRHGSGGQARARTTEWAVRLLLRAGNHDVLARLVADVVEAGGHEPVTPGGVDPTLLAAAAMSPTTLTSSCRRRPSRGRCSTGPENVTPALLIKPWSGPTSFAVAAS